MTVSEKKSQILLTINQQVLANVVDELAKLSVENDEIKEQLKAINDAENSVPKVSD